MMKKPRQPLAASIPSRLQQPWPAAKETEGRSRRAARLRPPSPLKTE